MGVSLRGFNIGEHWMKNQIHRTGDRLGQRRLRCPNEYAMSSGAYKVPFGGLVINALEDVNDSEIYKEVKRCK